jgi:hypothetical protein
MMDKYSEIEREILDLIQNSGLRNNCELNMVFVGDTDKILPFDEMIENLNYIKGGSIKDFTQHFIKYGERLVRAMKTIKFFICIQRVSVEIIQT